MALVKAHEAITPEELKEIFRVPSNEMVSRHVHKLVQVTSCCPFASSMYSIFFIVLFTLSLHR